MQTVRCLQPKSFWKATKLSGEPACSYVLASLSHHTWDAGVDNITHHLTLMACLTGMLLQRRRGGPNVSTEKGMFKLLALTGFVPMVCSPTACALCPVITA